MCGTLRIITRLVCFLFSGDCCACVGGAADVDCVFCVGGAADIDCVFV